MREFVFDINAKDALYLKLKAEYTTIIFVQRKVRALFASREAKTEVLVNYWNKMVGQLQKKASLTKDKDMLALIGKICIVPAEVKRALLWAFVSRCRELHAIAFLQWRLQFPSSIRHEEEALEHAIKLRIFNLTSDLISVEKVSALTLRESRVAPDTLVKYEIAHPIEDHLINSFQCLGWADPFPNDGKNLQGSVDDWKDVKLPS